MKSVMAKVWNDNTTEYREMFKGTEIVIPARGFITMEATEANVFRGQFTTPVRDTHMRDLKPKMLRVEKILDAAPVETETEFLCPKDGSKWPTQAALDNHIAKNYADLLDEDGKKSLAKSRK